MSGCWLNRNVGFWGWFEAGCKVDCSVFIKDSYLSVRSGFYTEPTRVPVCPDYAGVWRARRLSTAGRREDAWHAPAAGPRVATGQRLAVMGQGAAGSRMRVTGHRAFLQARAGRNVHCTVWYGAG